MSKALSSTWTEPSLKPLSSSELDSLSPLELESLARLLEKQDRASQSKTEATEKFTRYRNEPVAFVREILGLEPWGKQAEILNSVRDHARTTVRSCHGAGKTWTAASAALWFLQTRPGSVVITTAPSGRQVRDLLWRQIRAGFENANERLIGRVMQTTLECGTDWYATGFSTDEPINFQGPHSPAGVLFIGDEASGLAEWVFDTARGFMTQEDAKMLLIGNPNKASGSYFESHGSPQWHALHISAFDVPPHILRPDWKEEMLEEFGADSPIYQVRVLGNFPFQSENSLFDMTWIEDAMHRPMEETSPTVIGVDIARFGTDDSNLYVAKGKKVVDHAAWHGKDLMKSAGIVAEKCRKWWPDKVHIDEIGIGSGVLDRLKEQGWPAVGINSNGRPRKRDDFFNLRAELYANLACLFRDGEISIPMDKVLMKQLIGLTYEHTSKGQRKIISKEDLRKAGKPSPDRADALMLTFAGQLGGYRARGLAVPREIPASQRPILSRSPRREPIAGASFLTGFARRGR